MKLRTKYRIPAPKESGLEREFRRRWLVVKGPGLVPEYSFDPTRKWRFDFAIPDARVAFECHGGVYSFGRHLRGRGFVGDCEKTCWAALHGWVLFPLTRENMDWPLLEKIVSFVKERMP